MIGQPHRLAGPAGGEWDTGTRIELTRLSGLIDQIYACATNPVLWVQALAAISEWLGAHSAILLTPVNSPETGGFFFIHKIPALFQELYEAQYQPHDVWATRGAQMGLLTEGNVVRGEDLVPHEELKETHFYKGFLSRLNIEHMVSCIIYGTDSPGGMPVVACTFHRGRTEGFFLPEDVERLGILVPHLSRSLGVMYRLRDAELQVASNLVALDRLCVGVLLISGRHTVIHANVAARRMLEGRDGMSLKSEPGKPCEYRLVVEDRKSASAVQAAMREAVAPDILATAHFSRAIAVQRPSCRQPYVLSFSSLAAKNQFTGGPSVPRAIVFVTGGDGALHIDAELLAQCYGLTPAESRVACLAAEGLTVEEMADRLGVQPNTLKTHLKAIYIKTRVASRAQLAKLVHAMARPAP
jgi:DNA-binding CsgD family transcriptional regulator